MLDKLPIYDTMEIEWVQISLAAVNALITVIAVAIAVVAFLGKRTAKKWINKEISKRENIMFQKLRKEIRKIVDAKEQEKEKTAAKSAQIDDDVPF